MYKFYYKDFQNEALLELLAKKAFGENPNDSLKDFSFYEYSLSDLGLPTAESLLESVRSIQKEVGLRGWRQNSQESKNYKGFSLTYNPQFYIQDESIYHQTWGSNYLTQSYSRNLDIGSHNQTKDTYYDTYSFRKIPPIIDQHLGSFFKKFRFSLLRSRVAFHIMTGKNPQIDSPWHIDEYPYQLLRINIPLTTSEEYVLDISGQDEYSNFLEIKNKHLEVGKLYIWNTRIPHRVTIKSPCQNPEPRIHMVLGFSPWIDYVDKDDSYIYNQFHGVPMTEIVNKKLFLK